MKNNNKFHKNNLKSNINKKVKKNKILLTLVYSALVFIILLFSLLIICLILYYLIKYDIIPEFEASEGNFQNTITFFAVVSLITGSAIGFGSNYYALNPLKKLTSEMNKLASGDFSTRLKWQKPFSHIPAYKNLAESFNTMAEELENTEMLRSDFINNFSHEFKTPIVSITGFAKLLQRENISDEDKKLYASIIEKESLRLSFLATNILNLTKLENQNILTNTKKYNVSEQIRECFLMLEEKWREKELEINLDFHEYIINANPELMRQVFINLLDNAIKFTPTGGKISVELSKNKNNLQIIFTNTGSEIKKENQKKIFGKFYQADESHAGEGSGVGLAIVKKIIELHSGCINVKSENMITSFIIDLQI